MISTWIPPFFLEPLVDGSKKSSENRLLKTHALHICREDRGTSVLENYFHRMSPDLRLLVCLRGRVAGVDPLHLDRRHKTFSAPAVQQSASSSITAGIMG